MSLIYINTIYAFLPNERIKSDHKMLKFHNSLTRSTLRNSTMNCFFYREKSNFSRATAGCIWLSVTDTGKWTSSADVSISLVTSC